MQRSGNQLQSVTTIGFALPEGAVRALGDSPVLIARETQPSGGKTAEKCLVLAGLRVEGNVFVAPLKTECEEMVAVAGGQELIEDNWATAEDGGLLAFQREEAVLLAENPHVRRAAVIQRNKCVITPVANPFAATLHGPFIPSGKH